MRGVQKSGKWSTLRSKRTWILIALFITILCTQSFSKCSVYFDSESSNDHPKDASFDFHDSKLSYVYVATGEESGHRHL